MEGDDLTGHDHTLLKVRVQLLFPESNVNLLQITMVLFLSIVIDEDIIEVNP